MEQKASPALEADPELSVFTLRTCPRDGEEPRSIAFAGPQLHSMLQHVRLDTGAHEAEIWQGDTQLYSVYLLPGQVWEFRSTDAPAHHYEDLLINH